MVEPDHLDWLVYPFEESFWRRVTVQSIAPHLTYFGPLPQTSSFAAQIVATPLAAYVYVIQDNEGDVLYVGKTINFVGRLSNHRSKKAWWPSVGQLTLLGVEADCREEADWLSLRLEAIAIKALTPRHNLAGVI